MGGRRVRTVLLQICSSTPLTVQYPHCTSNLAESGPQSESQQNGGTALSSLCIKGKGCSLSVVATVQSPFSQCPARSSLWDCSPELRPFSSRKEAAAVGVHRPQVYISMLTDIGTIENDSWNWGSRVTSRPHKRPPKRHHSQVRVVSQLSPPFLTESGVRQGCVLAPSLFCMIGF